MKSTVIFRSSLPSFNRVINKRLAARRGVRLLMLCVAISVMVLWLGASRARMASFQINIPAGSRPGGVAVNSVTNKIYVTNSGSNDVTVINGPNHTTTTVPVGTQPGPVAVNPVTNKIYVANMGSTSVTVIDGADYSTVTVPAGTTPQAITVNSVTNKIYVANKDSNNVTVIDGADNSTATVPAGTEPFAIAVNPVTNKIYVVNSRSNNVTVINGVDNTVVPVATGVFPVDVAVNPVTNKIYVANLNNGTVTIINGPDNSTLTVPNGPFNSTPNAVAVNPVTNKIYVSNFGSRITVINGADNTTASITHLFDSTGSVTVNPVANKIYATHTSSAHLTVIDGVDNSSESIPTGTGGGTNSTFSAVNPVTNKIYVVSSGTETVTADIVSVINGADNSIALVPVGTQPYATAINPLTNKVYVANRNSNDVTVMNGVDNSTATVAAGTEPLAIAVNMVTNKIYVANHDSDNVTVINGADNSTTTIAAGSGPVAIAVNPFTNKIYVANENGNNVTVINGGDNSTATISAEIQPKAIAVNQITNKIYVLNNFSNSVTIINGADNSTVTIENGSGGGTSSVTRAQAIAVNSVTNKIFVTNYGLHSVTVINGADNSTSTIPTSPQPFAVAVNPITNKIYAMGSADVTVINGADHTTAIIPTEAAQAALAVDQVTNKIYVTGIGSNSFTIINGVDNSTTGLPGARGVDLAVNPLTHKIYAPNHISNNVAVITEQNVTTSPLTVGITPEPFQPNSTSRTFTFTGASAFSPTAPPVQQIHYQLDTWVNPWMTATPLGPNPQAVTFGPLEDGMHILFAYATDGGDTGHSPRIGQIQAFPFFVNSTVPPPPTMSAGGPLTRQQGSAVFNSTIAQVNDLQSGPGSVAVTVTSANPSNGVTLSNIVNNAGTITADILADCTATGASFSLRASDANGWADATLNVSVVPNTAATLSYNNAAVAAGGSTTINPATGPSDNGVVQSIVIHSQGTFTGTVSIAEATGVISISNGSPGGTHAITVRATDNCGTITDSQFNLSVALSPTATDATVGGRILDTNDNPVEGVSVRIAGTQNRLTVTDANGNYRFDNVETKGFYTLVPSRANYVFSPAQRSFSQLGEHTDATFNATSTGNVLDPLDTTEYFVRQQYVDFLGREPDEAGLNFWIDNIDNCGDDAKCRDFKRIDTSAAFFLSIEFQQTGYLVYRTYQAAYGDLPGAPVPIRLSEFKPDTQAIGGNVVVNRDGWQDLLENNQQTFVEGFVQRPRFTNLYASMNDKQFVDALNQNAGFVLSQTDLDQLARDLSTNARTRAEVLRTVAENSHFSRAEFNQGFVLMQYFGYLRRDADSGPDTDFTGYNFWLIKLNAFGGKFQEAEMVKAFLTSTEYRQRFPR
ncbi:MAG TPA: carboxypeptidase regulatory-like domain-containing protein [Pyrinomonadaceae bacterium]|nr:carboxypeptidase regulatory-like domain-containing protein [Pyrinomonadaceae bacterium]